MGKEITSGKNLFIRPLLLTLLLFATLDLFGQIYPFWLNSSLCFKYLGCNAGIFGYDAALHVACGLTCIFFFLWLNDRNPNWTLLPKNTGAQIVSLLALVCLIGVAWEMSEYAWINSAY